MFCVSIISYLGLRSSELHLVFFVVLRGNNNKQVSTRERTLGKRPLASSARYFIHIRERARLSVYMKVCKLRTKNINDSFGKENRHSESSSEID